MRGAGATVRLRCTGATERVDGAGVARWLGPGGVALRTGALPRLLLSRMGALLRGAWVGLAGAMPRAAGAVRSRVTGATVRLLPLSRCTGVPVCPRTLPLDGARWRGNGMPCAGCVAAGAWPLLPPTRERE